MFWNPYVYAFLGADPSPVVRDHRGDRPGVRIPPRDPRPQPRPDDRVPIQPQPRPDDRVPIQPQRPDPRVTTRPEDLRPRRDDDRRDWRRHRRYRDRNDLPWGQRYYGDYIFLDDYGWLPRWYPYWDPQWFNYWWYLFDYYGGDVNPDYAAYARDAALRSFAPRYGWR